MEPLFYFGAVYVFIILGWVLGPGKRWYTLAHFWVGFAATLATCGYVAYVGKASVSLIRADVASATWPMIIIIGALYLWAFLAGMLMGQAPDDEAR